uniref:Uncharacterized protein n=1 Tax=Rangifer tarandus platyrhynchus TaxID=3082113 RepID=A0ACB0EVG4_RANTA|nr:unnamed protein product [Rangifer tarandus platyrhynchus]
MARTLAARGLAQADSWARPAWLLCPQKSETPAYDARRAGGPGVARGLATRGPVEPPTAALHRERRGKPPNADRKRSCALCLGDKGVFASGGLPPSGSPRSRSRPHSGLSSIPPRLSFARGAGSERCCGGGEAGGEPSSALAQRSGGGDARPPR